LTKTQLIYSVSCFNLGRLSPPVARGLYANLGDLHIVSTRPVLVDFLSFTNNDFSSATAQAYVSYITQLLK